MQTTNFTRRLRVLMMTGAVAAVTAGAVATPALADDWHGHDAWRGQEWHQRAWRGDDDERGWSRPVYGYNYYYAYPYAYSAPAPVYAAPPSVGFYFGIR